MKKIAGISLILYAGFLLFTLTSCTDKTQSKPNIILIIADDQSYSTLPSLSNSEVHAPNIEKLAAQGYHVYPLI